MRNMCSRVLAFVTLSCALQATPAAQSPLNLASVAVGRTHACATTTDGRAYCWGDNDHGQLGNGTTKDHLRPVPIGGGLRFKQIVHGGSATSKAVAFFTCGLTTDGQAYCWGNNDLGQLGDGTREDRSIPTPVEGTLKFDQLRAGAASACGLTNDKGLFCWGAPGAGALGLSAGTRSVLIFDKPTEIPLPGPAWPARFIADGVGDPCVLGDDGVGYCWNEYEGRLGVGVVTPPGKAFQALKFVGSGQKCGVTTTGELLCWTESKDGRVELSLANFSGRVPAAAGTVAQFQQLADGTRFRDLIEADAICALTVEGKAMCTTKNAVNGIRPELKLEVPELTIATLQFRISERCALTTNGEVHCWSASQPVPVRRGPGHTFTSLSIEGWNACAAGTDGSVHCWGENSHGQVGDGTRRKRDAPVAVKFP